MSNKLSAQIKLLIAKDELGQAIQLLTDNFTNSDQLDQLILQSGRYQSLRKDQLKGVIDYEDQQKSLNQLRANILDFINNQNIEEVSRVSIDLVDAYELSKARIQVLQVLIEQKNAETISTIYKLSNIKKRKWVVQVLQELLEGEKVGQEKKGKSTLWKLTEAGIIFTKKIQAK